MTRALLLLTSLSGFLAVALGAFGAHALKLHLTSEELLWFETASRYQFYHTLAALAVVLLMMKYGNRWLKFSCLAFLFGIFLFSGSLYVMAVTEWRFLGAITPLGGLSFIAGWGMMAVGFFKQNNNA